MAILSGHSEADSGTVITVAAGMSWIGSLQISAGSTPTFASPYIEVLGGGVNGLPIPGTKVIAGKVANQNPVINVVNSLVYLEADDEPLTLVLRFNGVTSAIGIANGYDGGVPG